MTDLAGTPDDFSPPIAIPNPARASTLMTTPTPLDRGFLCFSAHSSSLTPSHPHPLLVLTPPRLCVSPKQGASRAPDTYLIHAGKRGCLQEERAREPASRRLPLSTRTPFFRSPKLTRPGSLLVLLGPSTPRPRCPKPQEGQSKDATVALLPGRTNQVSERVTTYCSPLLHLDSSSGWDSTNVGRVRTGTETTERRERQALRRDTDEERKARISVTSPTLLLSLTLTHYLETDRLYSLLAHQTFQQSHSYCN
ncbi:hypothetical protein CSIM01_11008 [Colletotrichum simmondsii]|uniref:Uncharacterized protein n=1 Tax=Colletotrichum simmondsii TaxID=703756 RepID=A0A135TIZ5_9PEZI|nr:hypothetical protein CSIM01_11008 [Colletotrichum simmondsii]